MKSGFMRATASLGRFDADEIHTVTFIPDDRAPAVFPDGNWFVQPATFDRLNDREQSRWVPDLGTIPPLS